MNGDELNFLTKQFTDLKARYEERWDAHDKRADELISKVDSIMQRVWSLPCEANKEKFKSVDMRMGWLWFFFVVVIVINIVLKWTP